MVRVSDLWCVRATVRPEGTHRAAVPPGQDSPDAVAPMSRSASRSAAIWSGTLHAGHEAMKEALLSVIVVASVGAAGCGGQGAVGQIGGVHVARCGPADGPSVMFGLDQALEAQRCDPGDSLERASLLISLQGPLRPGSFVVTPDVNAEATASFRPPGGGAEVFLSGSLTIDTIDAPIVTGQYALGPIPGEGVRRARFESNRCEDALAAFAYQRCGSPFDR
jgi:hypothetical protein